MPKVAEADEGTGPFTRPRGKLDAQEVWNRDERATTPEVSVKVANKGLTSRQEYLAHRAGRGEHISVTEYSHSSRVSLASVEVVAICRDASCKELATAERTSLRSE